MEIVGCHSAAEQLVNAMPTNEEKSGADACLELNCAGYQLAHASITKGIDGAVYRVNCGPIAESEFVILEHAAQSKTDVRLVFADFKVRLASIEIEHLDAGWVHIAGHVVN
jgi:hypothetical protein